MARFKSNRQNGLNVLDDDAGLFREEEDVYDKVDEAEYANLVESRRQREDFVVDDGTCGLRFTHTFPPHSLYHLFINSLSIPIYSYTNYLH